MGRLLAGLGRANITPPVGIEMGCWALRTGLAQGVHDDMYARALVLDDGATPIAIVSLDVLYLSTDRADRIRRLIASQIPLPASNILLNCSHTHTTPHTGPLFADNLTPGHVAYLSAFDHYVVGAVVEAWHNREEAAIGAASTEVKGVTVNRRDPALPADPELGVIRVDDADGRPMACLVNFACHGTSVGAHYLLWTADFPGFLARAIEDVEPDCTCMFLQGAEGDIHPWDWYFGNEHPRWGDTYEASERLGKAIAGPALGLLHQIATSQEADIRVASSRIELPPRPINWTAEEAESYLAQLRVTVRPWTGATAPDDCPGCMSAQRFPDAYALGDVQHEAEFARHYPQSIPTELTIVQINNIVLASFPGELFNELGLEVKARSPYEFTYISGVTNGRVGYIPTREAAEAVAGLSLQEFTDQVKHRRQYGATAMTEVGPAAGEMIVEELLRLISSAG